MVCDTRDYWVFGLRKETDPVFETLHSLEYGTMDRVQKHSNPDCVVYVLSYRKCNRISTKKSKYLSQYHHLTFDPVQSELLTGLFNKQQIFLQDSILSVSYRSTSVLLIL
jgi:hypothetical protein